MKTATIEELARRPEKIFQRGKPVKITRDGHTIGVVQPLPDPAQDVPLEVRRKLFAKSAAKTARKLDAKGITEEQVERDIEALLRKPRGRR